ncbi:MAG TPA: glycosyltransferase family 87 protein [Vicinamibacterales bacterium]|nr:glycosyltransferase family 87 protein [Vicinamibacterales bacterium]
MADDDSRSAWRAAVTTLAASNLVAGVVLSLGASHAGDLVQVVRWAGEWLHGLDPYSLPDALVDYPPWGLVWLAPLAWIPGGVLTACWVAVNLGLAAWAIATLVGWAPEPRPQRVLLAALLASAASFRTLSQFSLLSFALAIAGAASPSRAAGGVLLGLSLFKPQIGGAIALWSWLRGQHGRVLAAIAVVLALWLVFSWRLDVDPITVAREYAAALGRTYGDLSPIPGHTDVRTAIVLYLPQADGGWLLTVAIAAALFAPLGVGLWRTRGALPGSDLEVAAFCGVVSLLSLRHLSYDLLLLLPLIVAWRVPPFAGADPRRRLGAGLDHRQAGRTGAPPRERSARFWVLAALLVIELPSWYRRVLEPAGLTMFAFLTEFDRVLCVGVWVALAWRFVVDSGRSTTDEGTTWRTPTTD